jgi:hypothetical protein
MLAMLSTKSENKMVIEEVFFFSQVCSRTYNIKDNCFEL